MSVGTLNENGGGLPLKTLALATLTTAITVGVKNDVINISMSRPEVSQETQVAPFAIPKSSRERRRWCQENPKSKIDQCTRAILQCHDTRSKFELKHRLEQIGNDRVKCNDICAIAAKACN